jgi:hypothetical protein
MRDLIKNLEKLYYFGSITFENALVVFNFEYTTRLVKIFELLFTENSLKAMIECVEQWCIMPNKIYELVKSLLLFLYCDRVKCVSVNMDLVGVISKENIDSICVKIIDVFSGRGLDIDLIFDKLFMFFDKSKIYSKVELCVFFVRLYNYIHLYNLNTKREGVSVGEQLNSVENKQECGRRFVGGYKKSDVCSEDVENQKLYPHSLLNLGFNSKKKSEVDMLGR